MPVASISISSEEHSAKSRARTSWVRGEAERKEALNKAEEAPPAGGGVLLGIGRLPFDGEAMVRRRAAPGLGCFLLVRCPLGCSYAMVCGWLRSRRGGVREAVQWEGAKKVQLYWGGRKVIGSCSSGISVHTLMSTGCTDPYPRWSRAKQRWW